MLFWEDFHEGHVASCGRYVVGREEILAFARDFDPTPIHLDDAAAAATPLAGLAASGWHICAIFQRLLTDGLLLKAECLGSPGIEEARFLQPVHPGAVLSLRRAVLETRASKSRPEMGLVKFRFELLDSAGTAVFELVGTLLFGRRNPGARLA
ncbi:MaoC/PaaZ C-terminal domain-containing protein [Ancylobacter lacus]|uniref:MaoC/PaaZ C-terminal domain-containing protein n=1 Tax=Ancylobacter lacus TaxID=2579970 RepID=UPI001BCDA27A|nr:MaoC/PaaZ C-terminal domain-containing protein [Ancylobacter lacus]MBS7540605.1 dehydratase [Ancylobacter lacus]